MRIKYDEASKSLIIRIVVTVAALAVAAVHLIRPTAKIDGVLLGLLVVARFALARLNLRVGRGSGLEGDLSQAQRGVGQHP